MLLNIKLNKLRKMDRETKYKYKDIEYDVYYGLSIGYSKSLELLHKNLKWHHEELGSYQGDYYHIGINDKGVFYLKVNSYGSCSGCDWVQGIDSEEEAIDFFKEQEKLQCLGDNKEEVLDYIRKEIENNWDFEEENYKNIESFVLSLK